MYHDVSLRQIYFFRWEDFLETVTTVYVYGIPDRESRFRPF